MTAMDPYTQLIARGTGRQGECITSLATPASTGYRYIQQRRNGRKVHHLAHRVAYQAWHGEIPKGYHVDHVCHNEAVERGECAGGKCHHLECINPVHLRAVTPGDNFRASGLVRAVLEARKARTHCSRGHEYTPESTVIRFRNGTPRRECLPCRVKVRI